MQYHASKLGLSLRQARRDRTRAARQGDGSERDFVYDIMISFHPSAGDFMAQVIVRDLEDTVKTRLKRRAERHGRSMEEEIRDILRNAAKEENRPLPNLGSRIAARFAKSGLTKDLPELRGQAPRPAALGK
jgi:plasmid stability protein